MKSGFYYPLFNRQAFLFVGVTCVLNCTFLYFSYPQGECFYLRSTQMHGEVGYNLYKYNTLTSNPKREGYISSLSGRNKQLYDYADIDHEQFGPSDQYRTMLDTIGLGIVIGLLWKMTHSLRYRDLQILNLFLFAIMMFFLYQLFWFLFESKASVFWSMVSFCLYFPIFYLNGKAHRDIWAFYGLVMLLYVVLGYLKKRLCIRQVFFGGLWVGICQFVRPTLWFSMLGIIGFCFWYAWSKKKYKSIILLLMGLLGSNILSFWVPFMAYNKRAYGQCFVGPRGQPFLTALSEFPNRWGYSGVGDGDIVSIVQKETGCMAKYGTQEFDDAAKTLFLKNFKEDPWFYLYGIFRRIPRIVLPAITWFFAPESIYEGRKTLFQKILKGIVSPKVGLIILLRFYIRLYFILSYIGLYMLYRRKKYLQIMLVLSIILSTWVILGSHIESRYLTPFFVVYSFFFGYFLQHIWLWMRMRRYAHTTEQTI